MTLIVNGEKIQDEKIQQEMERLRPHYEKFFSDQDPQEQEATLYRWSRENVIERALLNQQARKLNANVTSQQLDSTLKKLKRQYERNDQKLESLSKQQKQKIKKGLENQVRVEQLLSQLCKDLPGPSEDQIKNYYKKHKEQFSTPERIYTSHIIKYINFQTDEATARGVVQEAKKEIENGRPFEDAVKEYSDTPDIAGGNGYITKGQMVEEFEDVAFNLAVGQVSNVFATRFGFHLVKLLDRKPPEPKKLDLVREEIREKLAEQMQSERIEQYLDRLKQSADIHQQ